MNNNYKFIGSYRKYGIKVFRPYYDGRRHYLVKLDVTTLLEELAHVSSLSYIITIRCLELDQ